MRLRHLEEATLESFCRESHHNPQKWFTGENSIFAKHSSPARRDPRRDLDGVLQLTLVCRVHILEPYIHTYENMTYALYSEPDFLHGLVA